MTKVNNIPVYAWFLKYLVIFRYEGEWWFYDATNDDNKAMEIAWQCDGEICLTRNCEQGRF